MAVKYISIILGAVFEIYTVNIYTASFSVSKTTNRNLKTIVFIIVSLFQIIASFLFQGPILLLCSIIMAYSINQLYKSKQYVKMILSLTYIIIGVACEMLASGLLMIINSTNFEAINLEPHIYSIGILISKFITFLFIVLIKLSKIKFSISNLGIKYLLILSISTTFLLVLMYQIMWIVNALELKILFFIMCILMIISNIVTFEIIRNQNRLAKSEYELKLLKGNLSEQTKHYEQLRLSHDEIRKLRHDMKNTYLGVIASLEANNTAAAVEQLKSDLNIIYTSSSVIDTGHPAIDAVIENKLKRCKELNIYPNLIYNYTAEIRVNEIEIAVIIGNILDNAIEGCLRSKQTNGIIYGAISSDEENIIVDIRNTANGSNNFKTLKRNKKAHGFGLKSVSHIAKKHNGYAKYTFENNEFSTFVMMEN